MNKSASTTYVFRLLPQRDLKQSILDFARTMNLDAGLILTCVGSLEQYHLRFANQKEGSKRSGRFEIVSLTGTFSQTACHLHMSVSDDQGKTIGGHLLDDNLIFTTAEIAIAHLPGLKFEREVDPTYGYAELKVISKK